MLQERDPRRRADDPSFYIQACVFMPDAECKCKYLHLLRYR